MTKLIFHIVEEREFTTIDQNGKVLTNLGGCTDSSVNFAQFGLNAYQYEIDVEVINQDNKIQQFCIVFQSADRNDALRCYTGYEMTTGAQLGCDADESSELLAFCKHDDSVLKTLQNIAEASAQSELQYQLKQHDA